MNDLDESQIQHLPSFLNIMLKQQCWNGNVETMLVRFQRIFKGQNMRKNLFNVPKIATKLIRRPVEQLLGLDLHAKIECLGSLLILRAV
jgi:hypothetical protein